MKSPEDKILAICGDVGKHNECSWLDYKIKPYHKPKKNDFLIDVIAMLNSQEAFSQDKYILFGINNNRKIIGLDKFPDDNEFQNMADKITPRPCIQTGTIYYENKIIGYIFIPASESKKRIYEINNTIKKDESNAAVGQAFTRKGSVNQLLTQKEREEIYRIDIINGHKKTNSPLSKSIIEKLEIEKQSFTCSDYDNNINFCVSKNDGVFLIGKSIYTFPINWYVVDMDAAHIIEKLTLTRVGFLTGCTEFPKYNDIIKFNFTSSIARLKKDEVAIVQNEYEKFAAIQLLEAKSSSHGASEDEVTFKYHIYQDKN